MIYPRVHLVKKGGSVYKYLLEGFKVDGHRVLPSGYPGVYRRRWFHAWCILYFVADYWLPWNKLNWLPPTENWHVSPEKGPFQGISASNHHFSRDMSVFKGVTFLEKYQQKYTCSIQLYDIMTSLKTLHHQSVSFNLKMMASKRNNLFQGVIFRWTMCKSSCNIKLILNEFESYTPEN